MHDLSPSSLPSDLSSERLDAVPFVAMPAAPAGLTLIELRSGDTRVTVAPQIGGAIAAYCDVADSANGEPLHWFRPATQAALAERDPLKMGSFPLFPYCNRIRDARFVFEGHTIDLSGDGNRFAHALHGHAWRREWRVGERTANAVELHFDHEPDAHLPGDWPFRYVAQQRIELIGNALHVTMRARNLSDRAMPFGMGHHPYHPRTPHTQVHAQVRAMWHADGDVLPTHLGAHPSVDALSCGMSADAFELDNNFAGWSREATVTWTDERRSVTLRAEAPFNHLVVFAPANDPQLCVEPVTNTTDCFNAGIAPDRTGGQVLAPDEEVVARLVWTPQRF